MVIVPGGDELTTDLWSSLLEISAVAPDDWTLVGAQMVFLHALERQKPPPRRTEDLDLVVDVRALSDQPKELVGHLKDLGYRLKGVTPLGTGHRYVRGRVNVDVLLPDNIGNRANRYVEPGAESVEVPGGSQALRRSVRIEVRSSDVVGFIPRPSLLGAILLKARAVEVDDVPDAQRRDLVFLLSLVDEPFELAVDVTKTEQRWLRRRQELLEPSHGAWRTIETSEDARAALRILAGVAS